MVRTLADGRHTERDAGSKRVATIGVSLAFAALLTIAMLEGMAGAPTLFDGWQIASMFVGFGLVAAASRWMFSTDDEIPDSLVAFFAGSVLLLGVLAQSQTPGFGLGFHRGIELLVVFGVAFGVFVLGSEYAALSSVQWMFVACFAVLVGLFWYHTLSVSPENVASRWPIWAGVVVGINLFVIPRAVPERAFLWTVAIISAPVALAGALTVVVGEYSVWVFDVGVWGSRTVTGIGAELPVVMAMFGNPNGLGLLAFGGLTAAVVEFHRSIVDKRWMLAVFAAVLATSNAMGLYLSHSRTSWLAAIVCLGIYAAYVIGGRAVGFLSTVTAGLFVAAGIVAVALQLVTYGLSGRVELWRATVEALRASPTLLGEGHVSTARFIEPYLSNGGRDPHNSYLTVAIRIGFVGGAAYAALWIGGIGSAVSRHRTVSPAMVAIASGWAVHQLFESYSIIQWTIPAVLSALSLGYLLFGDWERTDTDSLQLDFRPGR